MLTVHYVRMYGGRECWTDEAAWWECTDAGCPCEGISVRHGMAPSSYELREAQYVERGAI